MQGDIIKIDLNPKQGHEQQGYRPYICLSNRLISDTANIAVFAPISSTRRKYPLYVKLTGTQTTGCVLLDQLVTIDFNARNFSFVESAPMPFVKEILKMVVLVFQPNHDISL